MVDVSLLTFRKWFRINTIRRVIFGDRPLPRQGQREGHSEIARNSLILKGKLPLTGPVRLSYTHYIPNQAQRGATRPDPMGVERET